MAKSMIYVVNASDQAVVAGGTVSLGSTVRRFGTNCRLSGNGVQISGQGYYSFICYLVVEPEAIGNISATLYKDGVAIPGATASGYAPAANVPVTLPLIGVVREACCCENTSTITCVLSADGTVTNSAFKAEKM